MTIFSSRLQYALSLRGLSFADLARRTGISTALISKWNTGKVQLPNGKQLQMVADALNVNVAWLIGEDAPIDKLTALKIIAPGVLDDDDIVTFPVVGDLAAGYNHIAVEDWTGETVSFPREYLAGRPASDYFVLRIVGDSMYPLYLDGDIVLVLRQTTLERSGDVGVIIYDSDTASIKKVEFVHGEDWLRMVPINPTFPPVMVEGVDLEKCRILGVPKVLLRVI